MSSPRATEFCHPMRLGHGALLVGLVVLVAGCSSRAVTIPKISPSAIATCLLKEYDTNKDGQLDAKELDHCPALKQALKRLDKNGDGKLSEAELTEWLTSVKESNTGLFGVTPRVMLDGGPLAEATVTFTPEKCFEGIIKPATGVTDADGYVRPKVDGSDDEGVQPGLYRVTVSKKDEAGNERLPTRYNSSTVLGQEIPLATDGRGGNDLIFQLTSR